MLNEAAKILNSVMNEEQDAFDNMSEGLQQTMRGEQMDENVYSLQEAIDKIEEAIDSINDVM